MQDLCFTRGERYKVVTNTGDIISKSGAMTGGNSQSFNSNSNNNSSGGGGVNRWDEKELLKCKKRKIELEKDIGELKKYVFISLFYIFFIFHFLY